ncbi:hypothetical protein OKW11_006262 [Pseudomonas baetica]|nr:hypothetical protein [Pseudomonas baetica]
MKDLLLTSKDRIYCHFIWFDHFDDAQLMEIVCNPLGPFRNA